MFGRMFGLEDRVPLKEERIKDFEGARGYDRVSRISMRFPMENIIKDIKELINPGDTILDVGSQSGLLTLMTAGLHPDCEVFGLEEDSFLNEIAEENLTLATLSQTPGKVEFGCGSLTNMPIDDESADLVISYMPLFRVSDPVAFLKECKRVCKKGGTVFIYDMARDADEGTISFILQYVSSGHEEFMQSLHASYSLVEVQELLKEAGLDSWTVTMESLNLKITSREI